MAMVQNHQNQTVTVNSKGEEIRRDKTLLETQRFERNDTKRA